MLMEVFVNIKKHVFLGFFIALSLNFSFSFPMESEFEAGESSGSAGQPHNNHLSMPMNHLGEGEDCFAGSSTRPEHYSDEDICLINRTGRVIFVTVVNTDGDLVNQVIIPKNDSGALFAPESHFLITPSNNEGAEPENYSFAVNGLLHPGLTYNVFLQRVYNTNGHVYMRLRFEENLPDGVQATHPLHIVNILI